MKLGSMLSIFFFVLGIAIVIILVTTACTYHEKEIKEPIKDDDGKSVYYMKYNETGNITYVPAFEIETKFTETGITLLLFGIPLYVIFMIVATVCLFKFE